MRRWLRRLRQAEHASARASSEYARVLRILNEGHGPLSATEYRIHRGGKQCGARCTEGSHSPATGSERRIRWLRV